MQNRHKHHRARRRSAENQSILRVCEDLSTEATSLSGCFGVFCKGSGLLMAFAFILHGCKNKANNRPATDGDAAKVQQPSAPVAQATSINPLQAEGATEGVTEAVAFSLEPVTLQVGTCGCVSLKPTGAAQGYFIKSISIHTDPSTTTDYKCHFGLDTPNVNGLKKQPITASGLNIELTPNLRLKPDAYTLTIKLGKIGTGSGSTHKFAATKIILLGGESVEQEYPSSAAKVEQTGTAAPAPVLFTLSAITLLPGTAGCVSLKAAGAVEGYFIKSLFIHTDPPTTTDHKKKFGWDKIKMDPLKKQPITASGLNIELTPNLKLKPDEYTLTIKVGKIGKGSASTHQFVCTKITLLGRESDEQGYPSSATAEDQAKEDGPTPVPVPVSTPVPAPVSFTLEDITLPAGSSGCVSLKAVGAAEGYCIQSISIHPDFPPNTNSKNTYYYTKKFGLNREKKAALTNQPITAAGLNIELTAGLRNKYRLYTLKIKIGKGGQSTGETIAGKIIITDHIAAPTHTSEGGDQESQTLL